MHGKIWKSTPDFVAKSSWSRMSRQGFDSRRYIKWSLNLISQTELIFFLFGWTSHGIHTFEYCFGLFNMLTWYDAHLKFRLVFLGSKQEENRQLPKWQFWALVLKLIFGLQMSNLFMPYYYSRSKRSQSKNLYAQLSAYGLTGATTTLNVAHTEFRALQNDPIWSPRRPMKCKTTQK